jgi:hypothetical protein
MRGAVLISLQTYKEAQVMDFPESITVYKDGKCIDCTLKILGVSGGKQVMYVAPDGTVLKKEPLFRYNERLRRRKGEVGYAIKV